MRQQAGSSRTVRANKQVIKGGEKTAFFTGGNSSCRAHIRQHYEIYKERCKDQDIRESHHAIPRDLYRQMKLEKKATHGVQQTLDGVLGKASDVKTYTRDGVTHAVAQLVACDDQVCVMAIRTSSLTVFDQALALAEKPIFRNCLVAMRPKTMRKDLPSRHDIEVYIHNEFVAWLKSLKNDILVSIAPSFFKMLELTFMHRKPQVVSRRLRMGGQQTTRKRRFWG
jgi:hypothetical protein